MTAERHDTTKTCSAPQMLRFAGTTPETLYDRFKRLFGRFGKTHAAASVDIEVIVTVGLAQEGKVRRAGFGTGAPRAEALNIESDGLVETCVEASLGERLTLEPSRDQGVGRCLLLVLPIGFRQAGFVEGQGAMNDDIGVLGTGGLLVNPRHVLWQATEREGGRKGGSVQCQW